MEPLQKQLVAAITVMVAALGQGCVLTQGLLVDSAIHGVPCKVAATWWPEVVETPDPTQNGTPIKGIAGRVYLFGEEAMVPLREEGTLIVQLYDARPELAGSQAPALEEWRFDRASLKRLQKKDAFGWGYTVFLPWSTFKPEISTVKLRVRFEPAKGSTLFEDSPAISLNRKIQINTGSRSGLGG